MSGLYLKLNTEVFHRKIRREDLEKYRNFLEKLIKKNSVIDFYVPDIAGKAAVL